MTMRAFGPASSTTGAAVDLDFKTISIGFSKTVSIALTGFTMEDWLLDVPGRSLMVFVMSASGTSFGIEGSGDADGFGVGNGGGSSGVVDDLEAFTGALLRFRGEAFLVGDSGPGVIVCSGSNISEGSMFSFATIFFGRPLPRTGKLSATVFVVFLLDAGAFLGLFLGAGVKSSSLSSILG